MSGGSFDYKEWHFKEIAESIEREIRQQGKEKSKEQLWLQKEYYEQYPEEKYYPAYSEEVNTKLKEALEIINKAHIYAKRVDYFLAGDDGEESFLRRLKEDLGE